MHNRMKALTCEAGGALAKPGELLTLKPGKATLEVQAQEARDEAGASESLHLRVCALSRKEVAWKL